MPQREDDDEMLCPNGSPLALLGYLGIGVVIRIQFGPAREEFHARDVQLAYLMSSFGCALLVGCR
jgi:hypothetical protein